MLDLYKSSLIQEREYENLPSGQASFRRYSTRSSPIDKSMRATLHAGMTLATVNLSTFMRSKILCDSCSIFCLVVFRGKARIFFKPTELQTSDLQMLLRVYWAECTSFNLKPTWLSYDRPTMRFHEWGSEDWSIQLWPTKSEPQHPAMTVQRFQVTSNNLRKLTSSKRYYFCVLSTQYIIFSFLFSFFPP